MMATFSPFHNFIQALTTILLISLLLNTGIGLQIHDGYISLLCYKLLHNTRMFVAISIKHYHTSVYIFEPRGILSHVFTYMYIHT